MAATAVEKAFCVLELAKTNSVTVVQRRFRTKYGKSSPTRQSIYDWYKQFENTGCVCKRKSTGRPPVSEEQIDRVRDVYVRSPGKSTRSASLELQIPQPTVWKILRTVWPHWHSQVRNYLDERLPGRWIGRASEENMVYKRWPPRSPDLTPCDYFLWGYVKDKVFVPPLPVDIDDLKQRITNALATVDRHMLARVWEEFDYRVDICRVTNGAHIEHL